MPDPIVVPRADHRISRKDIDSDALKVLYRLHDHKYAGYLVGGSVRDLLLGRRPKDFDIGTDAHPYQIKKLFRNCWIIGRRFRLAHVKFGPKTIEVATFRKLVPDVPEAALEPESVVVASAAPDQAVIDAIGGAGAIAEIRSRDAEATENVVVDEVAGVAGVNGTALVESATPSAGDGILHKDNTFGTPEEDAFRRDFTINGLFYDIGTFSVIDYVGGLEDLEKRVVRSIGDPRVRFVEDPVRMLRAVVMAARLGFDLDPLVVEAIAEHRLLIQQASAARLLEEYYKILRSGAAEATFRGLARARLLELITPELKSCPDAVWDSLARLDQFRQRTAEVPASLTNTILIGALLCPLGTFSRKSNRRDEHSGYPERVSFDMLPVARKDLERLHHVLTVLPRLADPGLPQRVARGIAHRPSFSEALAWLDVFGDDRDLTERWRQMHTEAVHERRTQDRRPQHAALGAQAGADGSHPAGEGGGGEAEAPRRRRRRRRRRGPRGPRPAEG